VAISPYDVALQYEIFPTLLTATLCGISSSDLGRRLVFLWESGSKLTTRCPLAQIGGTTNLP
jgi:hypothetical protein